jgi:hypothetical protein
MVEKGLTEKIFFGKEEDVWMIPKQAVWISYLEVALGFPPSLAKFSCLDSRNGKHINIWNDGLLGSFPLCQDLSFVPLRRWMFISTQAHVI